MTERIENNSGGSENYLGKLKQEILGSLQEQTDPEIRRDLESVKNTLDNENLSDVQKFEEIKDELLALKEKGIISDYLADLERRVDQLGTKEDIQLSNSTNDPNTSSLLEQIASLPNGPEKDKAIYQIAEQGREKSSDHIIKDFQMMQSSKGFRKSIGSFFSNKVK